MGGGSERASWENSLHPQPIAVCELRASYGVWVRLAMEGRQQLRFAIKDNPKGNS